MTKLISFLIIVLLSPMTVALFGWALSMYWAWFIAPLGPPDLSWKQCAGVGMVYYFFTHLTTIKDYKELTTPQIWQAWISRQLATALAVPIGWCIYHLVVK
jgi:hypothetical protein